uniref:Uncharacterized protein n=1 Tax=Anguilla anguilla TaxID=7936 RepID=A0A0E9WG30_ANGAN
MCFIKLRGPLRHWGKNPPGFRVFVKIYFCSIDIVCLGLLQCSAVPRLSRNCAYKLKYVRKSQKGCFNLLTTATILNTVLGLNYSKRLEMMPKICRVVFLSFL